MDKEYYTFLLDEKSKRRFIENNSISEKDKELIWLNEERF